MDKQNPRLKNIIRELKKKNNEEDTEIWKEIAERLESPRREYAEVNLEKIDRHIENGEDAVVPGKVLGGGNIENVRVTAFDFSSSAKKKIEKNGGEALLLDEYIEENPRGTETRIIR